LHPISNAPNVVEAARKPSPLFLLRFIDVSHPRSIALFSLPLLGLDACASLPLLELFAASR
jgi:hypothetical protein